MKDLLLIICLFLSVVSWGQKEFAPIGAEWYYHKQVSMNPPHFGYTKLTSIKDSIIQNRDVRVIEVKHVRNDSSTWIEGYEYIHQNVDTIWYWKGNQFHILYNFSLEKGDSLLLYSEMLNQCTEDDPYGWNIIDSTYTIKLGEVNLKAYSSIPYNGSVWGFDTYSCEIIGNMKYLIPQNKDCVYDGIWYGPLRCYSDPVNGILFTNQDIKCDSTNAYPVSVTQKQKTKEFRVFPNPVIDIMRIDFESNNYNRKDFEVKIIDPFGKVHYHSCTIPQYINVDNLPVGAYFVLLLNKNKTIDYERFNKI